MLHKIEVKFLIDKRLYFENMLIQRSMWPSPKIRPQCSRPGNQKISLSYDVSFLYLSVVIVLFRTSPSKILNPNDGKAPIRPLGFLKSTAINVIANLAERCATPTRWDVAGRRQLHRNCRFTHAANLSFNSSIIVFS